jgi:hypothetical protein
MSEIVVTDADRGRLKRACRQQEIFIKGDEAVRMWDEITSLEPLTDANDPRRPERIRMVRAHDGAVERYQASLPWRTRLIDALNGIWPRTKVRTSTAPENWPNGCSRVKLRTQCASPWS